MALTGTTLSAAVLANDTKIVVTSATGFAAGYAVRMDSEFAYVDASYVSGTTTVLLRSRGANGTVALAHPALTFVTVGPAADFVGVSPAQTVSLPVDQVAVVSYSTSGAMAIPITDTVADINSTGAVVALTLANPAKDQNRTRLTIVSSSTGAHTVTYSTGFFEGSTSDDIATFTGGLGASLSLMAFNGHWSVVSQSTNVTIA